MFANRFTVLIDACSLAGVLKRSLILTLAEAELFRLRWSKQILDETERAIAKISFAKGHSDAHTRATEARRKMQEAFDEAMVVEFEHLLPICQSLPDSGDAHVLAAAIQCRAAVIVTENIKHFPKNILRRYVLEPKTADEFIADTLNLDIGRGVAALRQMRESWRRPEITPDELLLKMEADGMPETVDILRDHIESL
jgi:predicted nucleic acid-binding protein